MVVCVLNVLTTLKNIVNGDQYEKSIILFFSFFFLVTIDIWNLIVGTTLSLNFIREKNHRDCVLQFWHSVIIKKVPD